MDIIVLFGPTGCGKSRWSWENFPDAFIKDGSKWWNGYSNEETVIIDEFAGQYDYFNLLTLCDRYPLQVEGKGVYYVFNSKRIIFTSMFDPITWYKDTDMSAFFRRVKSIYKYDKDQNTWLSHVNPKDYLKPDIQGERYDWMHIILPKYQLKEKKTHPLLELTEEDKEEDTKKKQKVVEISDDESEICGESNEDDI